MDEALKQHMNETLKQGIRLDGRKLDEVRALNGEIALFPRTHGSAVLFRGNTQSLGVTTLAPTSSSPIAGPTATT